MKNVDLCVIGLGYVGLPLAVEFGKKRKTIGYDLNSKRINELEMSQDVTLEVSKNERILFETSERYRELLEQNVNLIDSKLQKSGLGEALGMSLPSKERILIMNLNN